MKCVQLKLRSVTLLAYKHKKQYAKYTKNMLKNCLLFKKKSNFITPEYYGKEMENFKIIDFI